MEITTFLLCMLILVLIMFMWRRSSTNFPPGIEGIPLLGCIPSLGMHKERTIAKWGREKGWPIFYLRMGITKIVVLNTFESIEEAYVKKGQYFIDRHLPIFLRHYSTGKGVVFLNGEKWKVQRRFGIHTLRDLGMGKSGMEGKIVHEIDHLSEYLVNNHKENDSVDITPIITRAVSNIVCQLVFNRRFNLDEEFSFSDSVNNKLMKSVTKLKQIMLTLQHLPIFNRIPAIAKIKKYRTDLTNKRLQRMRDYIKSHKETLDKNNPRDFIDAFLIASEEDKSEDTSFDDEQLLYYIQDLFFGGTDTTSFTLTWTFLYLAMYPDKQKQLHAEIDEVLGSNGNVSMSCLDKMPYAQAVMQEIFRLRPLVPLSMPRKTLSRITLMGYDIPKGTVFMPNIWSVHHNPERWPNPEAFMPERHIDSEGKFVKSKEIIPFSLGPRNCLGIRLAEMEHFMFMIGLLQKLHFSLPEDQPPPDVRGSSFVVLLLPPDFNMKITTR
ncbi:cytochrome P450 2U1 [Ciona intestinalis]